MFSYLNNLASSLSITCIPYLDAETCVVSLEKETMGVSFASHLSCATLNIYQLYSRLNVRNPVATYRNAVRNSANSSSLDNHDEDYYKSQNVIQRNVMWMGVPFVLVLLVMTIRLNGVRRKLARSMEEIDRQYGQLLEMDKKRKELLSILGHDLRSPIWAIRQFLELNQDNSFHWENRLEYRHEALISAINIQETLEELLEWASDSEFRIVPHPKPFHLRKSIDAVFNSMKLMAMHKDVKLINAIDPSIRINSDIRMVSVVMRNVIVNAVKFTKGGYVSVHAYYEKDELLVVVEDNGVGMTQSRLKAINEKGRIDSSVGTSGERGLGMGLSAAMNYVHRLGGHLRFESRLGRGTRVIITGLDFKEN